MAQYLVELGIDSISLNPDAVIKTTLNVLELEKRLGRKRTCMTEHGKRTGAPSS